MSYKKFIINILNENFTPVKISGEYSDYILDWKQIKINGEVFDFIYPNLHEKNIFVIEKEGVGEIGKATLNLKELYLDNIRIDSQYRRIGLASKMYQYIEDLMGIKIKPSPIKQSPEIKQYWNKNNGDK